MPLLYDIQKNEPQNYFYSFSAIDNPCRPVVLLMRQLTPFPMLLNPEVPAGQGFSGPVIDRSNELQVKTDYKTTSFPSPAEDYFQQTLDLKKLLVRNETATFILRAGETVPLHAVIASGDLLVVDRSVSAQNGDLVICIYRDAFYAGILQIKDGITRVLKPDGRSELFRVTLPDTLTIWGVVMWSVRKHKGCTR